MKYKNEKKILLILDIDVANNPSITWEDFLGD